MKKLGILGLLLLSSCATAVSTTRVPIEFSAMEYNSVASRYMDRPTTATVSELSDGRTLLIIQRDNYSSASFSTSATNPNIMGDMSNIWFSPATAPQAIDFIETYQRWRAIAERDGDLITREIGRTDSESGMSFKFELHSANQSAQYLSITQCTTLCLNEASFVFDQFDAANLAETLQSFIAGEFVATDLDEKYTR